MLEEQYLQILRLKIRLFLSFFYATLIRTKFSHSFVYLAVIFLSDMHIVYVHRLCTSFMYIVSFILWHWCFLWSFRHLAFLFLIKSLRRIQMCDCLYIFVYILYHLLPVRHSHFLSFSFYFPPLTCF